ncbi:MAG: SurA N-terminal domain-containing protein [Candidatus Omnitrophica bacterium]|nr:SurA N-terminal domain-containing protein [Candidatus Omnitrophota bacterium]
MKKWSFKTYPALLVFCLFFPVLCRSEITLLARVGNEAITSSDLQDVIQPGESGKAVVERLVEERLIFLEAREKKMKVSQSDIDGEYGRIMRLFPDPVRFYQRLKDESLTPTALRRRIERQIMVQQFIQAEISAKIKINPQELEAYLQKYRDELTRLESDFRLSEAVFATRAEIPEKHSDIEEKMKDLGFISFPELSEQIQAAVIGLKIGDFSWIIFFKDAYSIFQITEIKQPDNFNPSSLVLKAKQRLFREKYTAAYQELIKGLRNKTEIKYYLDEAK